MRRLWFKSLYFKWIILFTCLILAAQGLSMLFALRYILPEVSGNMSGKLLRKADFIRELHRRGTTVTDEILTLTGDTDINFYFFDLSAMPEEIDERYRRNISLDMLRRAADGEIVSAYTSGGIGLPFCVMALDGRFVLLRPQISGNDLTFFISAYQRVLFSGSFFASALIVLALIVVIRPIKKVTEATREVAGGNLGVQLTTRSQDEVGELIRNFNIMTQALQKNEYLKKDFVSNVSHEFKTPITSIEGFARLMKDETAGRETLNEYADIIIREAARLSDLSTSLLRLSVLDSDAIEPVKTVFQLDEQLREAVLLLQNKWESKNIEFDIRLEEIRYRGHEALLLQVWINLIDNAVKFSPHHAVITLEAEKRGETVRVSVVDQGPGVAPEHAEHIFDRFYKVDKSRAREGSGLGLSIAQHIVILSKGTVCLENPGARGARFAVTLPG